VMSRGKAEIGDVLITTEAPMGNVAQVDMPKIALAQRVIKYRGVEGILCNDYLANFMLSECFQKQLAFESTGSTVMGIKGSKLHKLKICFPKTVEQQRITEILRQKDKLIESEETNLAKLQKQKQGLMQDLLTGKVRVKI
jgi:type I restriction enzyme, S subunit